MSRPAVKVLVIDDHPALREGLFGLLSQEEGIDPVGALSGAELPGAVDRLRPDVVILDYALDQGDGFTACFRIKQHAEAPAVVLYSAYVDTVFAVPATLAQADAIVSKAAPVEQLLDAVHRVARGERTVGALDPAAMGAACSRLAADHLPIAGMLFSSVTVPDIARTLELSTDDVRARALRIIGELQARDRGPRRAEPEPSLS